MQVISADPRFSIEAAFEQPLRFTESNQKDLVALILTHTKSYFSKPLKESDVFTKLQVKLSPERATENSKTLYTFKWSSLEINTAAFTCFFELVSKEGLEQPIDLSLLDSTEEAVLGEDSSVDFPLAQGEPLSVLDAREVEKEKIRIARLRAARYLLRSEQLYKRYVEKWGDPESEWESSESESDDE